MAFSTIDKSSSFMNTKLYTGTGATHSITGVGFQPDFTWIKRRNSVRDHCLFNAISGTNNVLSSNLTSAEEGTGSGGWTATSDGFDVGVFDKTNSSGDTYVSWNWKANGSGSANTDGSISSTVSVDTTSGMSITTYTGTGSLATVGHGLGVAPSMIIFKQLDEARTWMVYQKSITATSWLHLDRTDAAATNAAAFNNTEPTSSVMTVNTYDEVNKSGGDYIAYCFADISGYSQSSKYFGNGNADGTFVYTGFKPTYVLIKKSDGVEDWGIWGYYPAYNVIDRFLYANGDNAEYTGMLPGDFLSNGFKIRTSDGKFNASGGTYIYMAFGQPIVSNSGTPATAR